MFTSLKVGFEAFRSHSKLWVILWLIIVFPAVFIFVFLDIYNASSDNVRSLELRRISTLHDTVESLIIADIPLTQILPNLIGENSDITDLKIASESDGKLFIIADIKPEYIGQEVIDTKTYRVALLNPGETYITPMLIAENVIDHAYRFVEYNGKKMVIFSAHDFSDLQVVLQSRFLNSVLSLIIIFAFVIVLAYWIAKQINYQKLFAEAKEKLHERDLFASSLAHELRSPLTAIKGYAELLRDEKLNNEANGYVGIIENSANRLIDLISDFLEATRIQSGKLALSKTNIDINTLVNKIVAELKPVATAKDLQLIPFVGNTSCPAVSDEKRLTQVLTNIISNSIKYTGSGSITVTVTPGKYKNIITIADTGFGISAEDQRKLFAPFARVGDETKQSEITGTGLGMWITKQIIAELGGTIEIESIKGVGTHVIITLPQ